MRTEVDLEELRREVEIMKHLPKHPNIVAFREAFEDKEAVYLVMELCHGGELFDRIVAKGHYSKRAASSVTKTILEIVKMKVKLPQLNPLILASPFSMNLLRDELEKLGHSVEDPDVKMLMESADVDGSGTLTYDEFVTMAVHLRRIGDDQLCQGFRYFDKNQTGYIEFDELKEALLQDDNSPNNEQLIKDIMLDVDKDKDDRISYQEFKAMMFTGMDWKMASRQYSRALLNAVSIKILEKSGQLK
ncbi:Calcium-dependent protein kinase 8 [Hibiscus syriacus]|uniref:non-specific serine/threonine protein kinase n=1 Tax=Hibiscus syriacus TaxID=106335 RepID=A0A6A2XED3_HIBSY|nr:Calcium-dependent protein kinase 8 [Hibiscus syriacus]